MAEYRVPATGNNQMFRTSGNLYSEGEADSMDAQSIEAALQAFRYKNGFDASAHMFKNFNDILDNRIESAMINQPSSPSDSSAFREFPVPELDASLLFSAWIPVRNGSGVVTDYILSLHYEIFSRYKMPHDGAAYQFSRWLTLGNTGTTGVTGYEASSNYSTFDQWQYHGTYFIPGMMNIVEWDSDGVLSKDEYYRLWVEFENATLPPSGNMFPISDYYSFNSSTGSYTNMSFAMLIPKWSTPQINLDPSTYVIGAFSTNMLAGANQWNYYCNKDTSAGTLLANCTSTNTSDTFDTSGLTNFIVRRISQTLQTPSPGFTMGFKVDYGGTQIYPDTTVGYFKNANNFYWCSIAKSASTSHDLVAYIAPVPNAQIIA